jgi:hypothetical protein
MEDNTIGFLTKIFYPEYADMDNEELGRKMRERFPKLFESAGSPMGTIQELQRYSSTQRGKWSSERQAGKSEARASLDTSLLNEVITKNLLHDAKNTAIYSEIKRRLALFEQREAEKIAQEQRDLQKATHHNELGVAQQATIQGLDKDKYLNVQEARLLDENRVVIKEREAGIEVNKYNDMKKIDIEVMKAEAGIDVTGAIVSRIAEAYEMEMLTHQMFKLVDKREDLLLEAVNNGAAKKKLKRLNKNIKALEEAIDEKAKRLTQGNNRRELGPVAESE